MWVRWETVKERENHILPGDILCGVSFSKFIFALGIGMLLTGIGYVVILQTLTAWFKNLYPEDQRGQFEGIKQLFFVCIPMIIGPAFSNIIISNFGAKGVVNGKSGMIPNEMLFIVSAVLRLITYLPLVPAGRLLKERKQLENPKKSMDIVELH